MSVKLKPAVRFREFPFGTKDDCSMRDAMHEKPQPDQDKVLNYLRSGRKLGMPMGADLIDWFDRPHKANVEIGDEIIGGATPMTDGAWFWHAGLIHFVAKYNVSLPREFLEHAAANEWRCAPDLEANAQYEFGYF